MTTHDMPIERDGVFYCPHDDAVILNRYDLNSGTEQWRCCANPTHLWAREGLRWLVIVLR